MTISKQDSPQNNFVNGIVTEASPLSFPPNASLDEVNFKLNRDGTRDRRLGIDFEDGFVLNTTGYTAEQLASSTRSFFRWPNPSGTRTVDIGVIQIGGYIYFCNLFASAPSAALLNGGQPINTGASNTATFEYAIIGTNLIVVSAELPTPVLVFYNGVTDLISYATHHILVRDIVGVDDGLRVDERPTSLSPLHRYNLYNQGWLPEGVETTCGPGISPMDCTFQSYGVYPANSDTWVIGRKEDVTDPNVKKYDPVIAARNLLNAGQSPRGHYIINAFDRGASRKEVSGIPELPLDRERGRIQTVAVYAGRAWYAGVHSSVESGDGRSPNFNGSIFFSQVMQSPIDLVKCYTEADPTNPDINDSIDTDGGVILIPDATVIVKLLPIKDSLFVFAQNGIWQVKGDETGFRYSTWQVSKISGMGVSSHRSIVEVSGQLFFWSYDGIYTLVQNQTGGYDTQSITLPTIQRLYNSLPDSARKTAKGYYDAANNKIRWLYYSEEADYTGNPTPIPGGGIVTEPFDLQALLDAGVANILAGVGSDYRLNVDVDNAFVAFQHKDAVYNGNAGAGGIRPAIGLSSAGIAMGYNDASGVWHNAVAIEADGDASFAGTVAANSILTNTIQLGGSAYTVQDIIDLIGSSPGTFDLQGALNSGVGYILAGTGGNYRMTVDPANAFVAFHHKDAVYDGVASAGAGHTALGISANGIGMGYNDPVTGAWTNAVSITSAGDATFKGTIAADSVIANNVAVVGKATTLGQMADDIATFADGSFNLQPALDAGVTNILAGVGANYRMTVDTTGAFVAFHHKDAVYQGTAVTGSGIRPALGISAAGMAMGFNDAGGTWRNSVVIDAGGNAIFAGTIAANSIIANSATIDGISIGTIKQNASDAATHIAATGNVHNVSLGQVAGDLDDIADGSTYFKTNSDEKAGAGRAANALDSAGDYIRSLRSTKIVVSAPNPTTGWVGDGAGIRLYQGGSLKVNIPVSGSPSFSGNITGGGDINITGLARFEGVNLVSGFTAAVHANVSKNAVIGVVGHAGSGGAGVRGEATVGYGVIGKSSDAARAGVLAENTGGGNALEASGATELNGSTTINGALTASSANVNGLVQCNSFRIDQTPTTGAATANFNANNKPGGTTTNTWISISCNGSTRYIPVWG